MAGTIHVIFAITALAVGPAMFFQRKGGRRHRNFGYLYCVALVLVNLSALSMYRDSGELGPFHILALISLATLSAGVVPALLRKPGNAWVIRHAYFMSWSYVGVVAAGVGQMAATVSDLPGVIAIGLPITGTVLVGGLLIHSQVPEALQVLVAQKIKGYRHS